MSTDTTVTVEAVEPTSFDPDSDKLYTTGNVAEMFSVSSETVRDWIAAGKLPAIRLGSTHLRVKRSELIKFANHKYAQAESKGEM